MREELNQIGGRKGGPPGSRSPALKGWDTRRLVATILVGGLVALALPVAGLGQSLTPTDGGAQATPSAVQRTQTRLAALLAKLPAAAQVGLVVVDVATEQTWFAHQPDAPLKPASLMKLLVTAAALERWGPQFRFTTRVYLSGGELWVVGAGDPGLGDERLLRRAGRPRGYPFDEWAAALSARGVTSLDKLVLDDGIFDQQWRHPDWPAEQFAAWYQAPVGGLNLNDNCLDARVALRGSTVALELWPPLPADFFDNALRPGPRHAPSVRRTPQRDTFEFVGTVARDGALGPITVRNPSVFFGHALKQALTTAGVHVPGEVVRRTLAPEQRAAAALVAEHSTPLTDVLWRCNTFSQNLFAECLLKALVAYGPDSRPTGRPGSWPAGTEQARLILGGLGVDLSGANLRDGSGLSHDNRLTARQIAVLLTRMHRHPHRDAFRDSLAVPGHDGSMRRQYAEAALGERLRGKTGTLAGVQGLAGYVTRPDGATLAFAVLVNGNNSGNLPLQVARVLADASEQR